MSEMRRKVARLEKTLRRELKNRPGSIADKKLLRALRRFLGRPKLSFDLAELHQNDARRIGRLKAIARRRSLTYKEKTILDALLDRNPDIFFGKRKAYTPRYIKATQTKIANLEATQRMLQTIEQKRDLTGPEMKLWRSLPGQLHKLRNALQPRRVILVDFRGAGSGADYPEDDELESTIREEKQWGSD